MNKLHIILIKDSVPVPLFLFFYIYIYIYMVIKICTSSLVSNVGQSTRQSRDQELKTHTICEGWFHIDTR
jgi:hypothetical protein